MDRVEEVTRKLYLVEPKHYQSVTWTSTGTSTHDVSWSINSEWYYGSPRAVEVEPDDEDFTEAMFEEDLPDY